VLRSGPPSAAPSVSGGSDAAEDEDSGGGSCASAGGAGALSANPFALLQSADGDAAGPAAAGQQLEAGSEPGLEDWEEDKEGSGGSSGSVGSSGSSGGGSSVSCDCELCRMMQGSDAEWASEEAEEEEDDEEEGSGYGFDEDEEEEESGTASEAASAGGRGTCPCCGRCGGSDVSDSEASAWDAPPGPPAHDADAECYVCFREAAPDDGPGGRLVSPCGNCAGSIAWIHLRCLREWVASSWTVQCPNCRQPYREDALVGAGGGWGWGQRQAGGGPRQSCCTGAAPHAVQGSARRGQRALLCNTCSPR
jgi:hypothetical protein